MIKEMIVHSTIFTVVLSDVEEVPINSWPQPAMGAYPKNIVIIILVTYIVGAFN